MSHLTQFLGYSNRTFAVKYTVTRTSGRVQVRIGSSNNVYVNSSGTYTFTMNTYDNENAVGIIQSDSGANKFIGTVSAISIIEIEPVSLESYNRHSSWYAGSTLRLGNTNAFERDIDPQNMVITNTYSADVITAIKLMAINNISSQVTSILTNQILMDGGVSLNPQFVNRILTNRIEFSTIVKTYIQANLPEFTVLVQLNGGVTFNLISNPTFDLSSLTKDQRPEHYFDIGYNNDTQLTINNNEQFIKAVTTALKSLKVNTTSKKITVS